MRNTEIKIILISFATFVLLYVLSLFVTQAVILDEKLKHISSIPWLLTFFIPGYVLGKHGNNKWYIYGISISVASNLIWLLHSQLLFMGVFPVMHVVANSLVCLIGSYIGSKRKASNKSVKQTD